MDRIMKVLIARQLDQCKSIINTYKVNESINIIPNDIMVTTNKQYNGSEISLIDWVDQSIKDHAHNAKNGIVDELGLYELFKCTDYINEINKMTDEDLYN